MLPISQCKPFFLLETFLMIFDKQKYVHLKITTLIDKKYLTCDAFDNLVFIIRSALLQIIRTTEKNFTSHRQHAVPTTYTVALMATRAIFPRVVVCEANPASSC